jgi:hypothetical protein
VHDELEHLASIPVIHRPFGFIVMGGLAKEKVTEVTWGSKPATHHKAVGVGIGYNDWVTSAFPILLALESFACSSRGNPLADHRTSLNRQTRHHDW